MIYTVKLLSEDDLKVITNYYDSCEFDNGLFSGKDYVPDVKNNLEMKRDQYYEKCEQLIIKKVSQNRDMMEYTVARKFGCILFSEYTEGMFYKKHNDGYLMGNKLRTDYSCTIALNGPDEYDGGELMIDIGGREVPYKVESGTAIVYPTGFSHRVNTVVKGTRKVCVLWIESAIQNPIIRQANADLYELHRDYVSKWANDEKLGDFYTQFHKVKFNLLRNFGHFHEA